MLKNRKNDKNQRYLLIFLFIVAISFLAYTIPSTYSRYRSTKTLTTTLSITKPIYTITLDNQNADVTQGTGFIYEKYSIGFYLNSTATTKMTTSSNGITVPEKEGYFFQGYYTQPNGGGIQYIDEFGKLTSDANSSNFTANGTLYAYYNKMLYNVLKKAANVGTYAKKYTGSHQDSMDASKSNETIYHWYGSTATNGTAILDMNNVIFAGQCWQMIRTTDTGGVKMIYNGEAVNNQCLNTRGTHIGYAARTSQTLSSNYWYGTDYTYDSTNKVFSISGTTQQTTWDATTGPSLIGKYTCKQTTQSGTCATLYLVESYYNATSGYVIPINSNSNYSHFGTLQFNAEYISLGYVGYMYNTIYTYNSRVSSTETMYSISSLKTTYWYADSVTWGSPTANKYNLNNPYQVTQTSDYPNLAGKYTFNNTDQTYTYTIARYIAGVSGSTYYYIPLTSSGNHTLSDFDDSYTYGDSYTDNGNGTYTINNPSTIYRSNWYTNHSSVGAKKYVCKNATNNTCSDLWYTTATTNTNMSYIKVSDSYKYAKGFSYDSSTNTYTLNNESVNAWNITDSQVITSLNNAHYTCFNTTGTCTTLHYIYLLSKDTIFYQNLTGGKDINNLLDEMLTSSNVNTFNSIIKYGVEAWYRKYLYNDYDQYIDDTIYCNDRIIRQPNGWKPNGGNLATHLQFNVSSATKDLSCTNVTDRFSVSNNSAKSAYKVGLMSLPEMNLLNQANAIKTGQIYWLSSPAFYTGRGAGNYYIVEDGNRSSGYTSGVFGVRPAISLVAGIEYSSGNGSMTDPYIVDLNSINN